MAWSGPTPLRAGPAFGAGRETWSPICGCAGLRNATGLRGLPRPPSACPRRSLSPALPIVHMEMFQHSGDRSNCTARGTSSFEACPPHELGEGADEPARVGEYTVEAQGLQQERLSRGEASTGTQLAGHLAGHPAPDPTPRLHEHTGMNTQIHF